MKKLLLPLLAVILFTSCQKQIIKENVSIDTGSVAAKDNGSVAAKETDKKIDVCHKTGNGSYQTINISENALPAHLAHGDVLPDADGDGYTKQNPCGIGGQNDCDDNNANINPSVAEVCSNGIDDNCNGQTDEGCIVIGANYQGGVIAYIFQPGDPGYVANETHGIIANTSSISNGPWGYLRRPPFSINVGQTGTQLGSGWQNTNRIINTYGTVIPNTGETYAALYCRFLIDGYDDWYLPSKDELNKLYENRVAIGGFPDGINYWSSSEYGPYYAWSQSFSDGIQTISYKFTHTSELFICPVRYF